MYEAWNDKMWNDAAGLLIWMSHPAYPSFVWQTYDYYYDPTGAYWGAKKACEHMHIQWNASNNKIKVVNTTAKELSGVMAKATIYDLNGKVIPSYGQMKRLNVAPSNIAEAFTLNFNPSNLAFGKKVTASSATGIARDASLIVDGGAGSRWESEYNNSQWICLDLGKKEKIEKVLKKVEPDYVEKADLVIASIKKHYGPADPQAAGVILSTKNLSGIKTYLSLKQEKAKLEGEVKRLEERMKQSYLGVLEELGASCSGTIMDGTTKYEVSYNPTYRTSIDKKGLEKLKIQHPDVYDDYVQTTENRRFAVKERKVA